MRHQSLLLIVLALSISILGCDSSNPVAPTGSSLIVTASPTTIGLTNASSLITVTGFKPDGNPLNPGSQVNLSTDLGVLDASVISVGDNGRAGTRLRADGRSGTATVTVTLPTGDATATATVLIGETAETKPTLSIVVTPSTLDLGETATIEVQAREADGSILGAGGRVLLRTSLGSIDDENLVTDASGQASTTFRTGNDPGTATITGSVDSSDEVTADVTIENQKPVLIINVNPSQIPVLGTSLITIIARDNNDVPLGPGHRIRLIADLGDITVDGDDVNVAFTDNNGEAEATFTANEQAGQGSVTAILDNSDPVNATIDIRDAASSIFLQRTPQSVTRTDEGVPINLLARVLNSQSRPVSGIVVTFESPFGSFSAATLGSVTSNAQGEAAEVLTVTANDLQTVQQDEKFQVKASVVSEGVVLEAMVDITVLGSP